MYLGSSPEKVVDILTYSQLISRDHSGGEDHRIPRAGLDLGMLSAGNAAAMARATVRPPNPESKMPIGFATSLVRAKVAHPS